MGAVLAGGALSGVMGAASPASPAAAAGAGVTTRAEAGGGTPTGCVGLDKGGKVRDSKSPRPNSPAQVLKLGF